MGANNIVRELESGGAASTYRHTFISRHHLLNKRKVIFMEMVGKQDWSNI